MTYSSMLVHLDLGLPNEAVLNVAVELAERSGASVIGITACQPIMVASGQTYLSGDVIEQDRSMMGVQTLGAEERFRAIMKDRVRTLQWRSTIGFGSLANFIADQVRAADLLIIAPAPETSMFDLRRRVDIGDVVMQIGRPVLVVPPSVKGLDLERVVVGWKDTRETRRAVWDALPLLRAASKVTIAEIDTAEDLTQTRSNLGEVIEWLQGHGVAADFRVEQSSGHDSRQLEVIAAEMQAGIMVTGAYGHNRVREWVLGGVTRDLLLRPARCSLLSH